MNNIHTKMDDKGRVLIPAVFRQALHLEAGDDIILRFEDNEIHMMTPEQALTRLQSKVKNYLDKADKPISLVDELIAMRRAEAQEVG
ncbi:MAG: hypothetical protein K0R76_1033 [Alphaproteobacteria bacterium]|jgi:AbrB family looped-hinge helix DNA binding protein|nr:hypothetical protein [Alphaproteobacteria bacterium]MDF3034079.1 hypothetical protein [Alphaproteobacteria bacterium]